MIDIVRIYQTYNIKYWTEGKNVQPGWINTQCPFCGDTSNHLGFNIEKQYYYCWRCKYKHQKEVFNRLNIPLTELKNHTIIQSEIIKKLNIKRQFNLPGSELNDPARKYLSQRNFDPDNLIKKYQLKSCNHLDLYYPFRIIIPIIYNNQIVSYTTRDYTNKQELRYKSCPKDMEVIEHKNILYNLDNCKDNYIIIVEGIFDCWRLGDNCCSTFGVNYTKYQINLLLNYQHIFILFDNDEAGVKESEMLGDLLSGLGKNVSLISIPSNYKDLADMSQSEADQLKKEIISNVGK